MHMYTYIFICTLDKFFEINVYNNKHVCKHICTYIANSKEVNIRLNNGIEKKSFPQIRRNTIITEENLIRF